MTTRLLLYNGAALALGERELTTVTDSVPLRRYLDQAWNAGFVNEVLDSGQWTFATRTQQLSADTTVETQFGHPNAFAVPTDLIKTVGVCSDEFFNVPLTDYQIEAAYFYASIDPIYVRYVSNDTSYGGDLARWTPGFAEYVRLYLAWKILPRLTGNKTDRDALRKDWKAALKDARSDDAMEKPTAFMPTGSWVKARLGARTRSDRGNRNSLIG